MEEIILTIHTVSNIITCIAIIYLIKEIAHDVPILRVGLALIGAASLWDIASMRHHYCIGLEVFPSHLFYNLSIAMVLMWVVYFHKVHLREW